VNRTFKLLLFFVSVVAVPALAAFTGVHSFVRAESLSFCGSCHTMTPWLADLRDPKSKSLAALHFRNRFIPSDQCYTCHVDYDFMGPIEAKLDGMRHVEVYYFGHATPKGIKLYKPFPNANCLRCHAQSALFLQSDYHRAVMVQILNNDMPCMTCHQPIHTPKF
jgi:cytochrome c nitrite reductase small subunit